MVLALSSNLILKQLINRARPVAEHLVSVETLSYPSGHAMMAMAFYGILIYLFWQFPWNKLLKYTITMVLLLLILSIGISRIYLGVHYPSDILGGYAAGFMWVLFCIIIFHVMKIFKSDPAT
jgi:undecaprenyl-diphosphatase